MRRPFFRQVVLLLIFAGFFSGCKNPLASLASKVDATYDAGLAGVLTTRSSELTISEDGGEILLEIPYQNSQGFQVDVCQVSEPSNLSIVETCKCESSVCRVKIQTALNFYGVASFQFHVSDSIRNYSSNTSTYALTVTPVQDPIELSPISDQVMLEDGTLVLPLSLIDEDQEHIFCNTDNVEIDYTNGSLFESSGIVVSGLWPYCVVTLSPKLHAYGNSQLSIGVHDQISSSSQSFNLSVTGVEDPTAVSDISGLEFDSDKEYIITIPYADPENDLAISCSISDLVNVSTSKECSCAAGICTVGVLGDFFYSGPASFKFSVTTAKGDSNVATAAMTIKDPGVELSILKISHGTSNTCVLFNNGRVRCWGTSGSGRYGDGTVGSNSSDFQGHTVSGLTDVVDIITTSPGSCALKSNGELWCWGLNSSGFLGDGTTTTKLVPTLVPGLNVAKLATSGGDAVHNCVILVDRSMRCWGVGGVGRLGNGQTSNSSVPVDPGLSNVVAVALGASNSCALVDDDGDLTDGHQVYCWGTNANGQVGTGGTETPITTPRALTSSIENAVDIAIGSATVCALTTTGEVLCWGSQGLGQVGATLGFALGYRLIPAKVIDSTGAIKVFASGSRLSSNTYNTFVQEPSGKVWGWGSNLGGRLTSQIPLSVSWTAIEIPGLHLSRQVVSADESACSLYSTGSIECWGRSSFYETGYMTELTQPTLSGLVLGARDHYVGGNLSVTVNADGTVSWWGWPGADPYRNLSPLPPNLYGPTLVSGLSSAVKAAASSNFACAMIDTNSNMTDGAEQVKCWGANGYRQLGVNSTVSTWTPTVVTDGAAIAGVIDLQLGSGYGCALLMTGDVKCWGKDAEGQRGNAAGTGTDDASSVSSVNLTSAVAIGVGEAHACAIRSSDKSVWCWGEAEYGKLGNNSSATNQQAPVQVLGLPHPAVSVLAAAYHSCALVDPDGNALNGHQVYCWGRAVNTGTNTTTTHRLLATAVVGMNGNGVLNDVAAIQANGNSTCVITVEGKMLCWGYGANYALGRPNQNNSHFPIEVDVTVSGRPNSFFRAYSAGGLVCYNAENGNYCFGGSETDGALLLNGDVSLPRTASPSLVFGE